VVSVEETKVKESNSFRFIKPLLRLHFDDSSAYSLLTFLCHAANNDTGESKHGHSSISYTTGLGKKAIRSAIRTLVDMGLITCRVRGTLTNKETNLYTVHYDKLVELATESKAGRAEFIQSQRARKAKWQRSWRGGKAGVERLGNTTSGGNVESETPDVEVPTDSRVEVPADTRVEVLADTRTTKYELLTKSTTKELEENQISGSREDQGLTTDDIQELEQEVAALKKLRDKAMSEKCLTEYQQATRQLQDAQARLNVANGLAYRAAVASAA
jgi:hypothetical protein